MRSEKVFHNIYCRHNDKLYCQSVIGCYWKVFWWDEDNSSWCPVPDEKTRSEVDQYCVSKCVVPESVPESVYPSDWSIHALRNIEYSATDTAVVEFVSRILSNIRAAEELAPEVHDYV